MKTPDLVGDFLKSRRIAVAGVSRGRGSAWTVTIDRPMGPLP